ncbi:alpha/beta hydrolase [Microbacterium sp. ZW T5_45]|uniref:alpha/beta hydrolase n=1 Tax=Microbacterium sp. ZW T5_45 TaxID=3378080 RepID=UPI0038551CB7
MAETLTGQQRIIRLVIKLLGALPEPAQRLIAGKPTQIDGQILLTEVQMALRLLNALPGSSFEELPLADARAQVDAEAMIFGDHEHVDVVEELRIPTRGGTIGARRYQRAASERPWGAVTYFHGGGWVVGSLTSTDAVCRFLAARTGLEVYSIDYRLAPEHPFPAAVHDAVDAYRWVRERTAANLPVAVAGDSAGGNLSAVVCAEARDDTAGAPDFQLLFFPVADASRRTHSYELFGDGYFLTAAQMDWYIAHYLPNPKDRYDPRASPLLADLAGQAPAHVAISGFDVLRDEGLAYATALRAAGVPTTTQLVEGHIHAFVNANGVGRHSSRALADSAAALVRGLQRSPRRSTSQISE